MFGAVDYVLLGLYFLAVTLLGARFYRKRTTTSEFFVGSRSMWWLPVAISVLAADTSAVTLLGNPGYAYDHDIGIMLYELAYSVSAWLVILIFLPVYSRLNLYTAYEYLERRFDIRVRWISSALFLIIRGSHVAIAMYAPALVLALFTGMNLRTGILIMGIVATFYTTMGGIKAVIWTDVMQFSIVVIGIVFAFFLTIKQIHGGLPTILEVGSKYGKWHMFDFSFDYQSDTSFWALFVGGTVLALATVGTDQAVLQRYFTAKSERECARSLKIYSIIVIPFNFALVLLGVFFFVFYQQHPALRAGLPSSDSVLAYFEVHQLPHLLATLLTASIFAASMGVMSAGINSLSTCSVMDFYSKAVKRELSEPDMVKAGRLFTIAWGVLATVGALYADRLGALALAFAKIQGFVGGVMLGIFLLAFFFRRVGAWGAIIGSAAGMGLVFYLAFRTDVSFLWYGAISCLATIAVGYGVSILLGKPVARPEYLYWRRPGATDQAADS